jgi:4-carboxymuconolactone decarboxylase
LPRVPFLIREDLPTDKQELYDQIAAHRGHVARPFAALLNSPEAASRVAMLGEQLRYVSPTISSEVREIITLTTARIMKCQYIWTHHCDSAKEAGVREEVIEAIKEGGPPRRLLPKESVFLQFTRELLEDKRVRDATYSAVEHLLGRQGAVDLIVTIGYYAMLCLAVNALEVDLEEGMIPLLPA